MKFLTVVRYFLIIWRNLLTELLNWFIKLTTKIHHSTLLAVNIKTPNRYTYICWKMANFTLLSAFSITYDTIICNKVTREKRDSGKPFVQNSQRCIYILSKLISRKMILFLRNKLIAITATKQHWYIARFTDRFHTYVLSGNICSSKYTALADLS